MTPIGAINSLLLNPSLRVLLFYRQLPRELTVSLARHCNLLATSTSITSLTIESATFDLHDEELAALAQLTRLRELTVRVEEHD